MNLPSQADRLDLGDMRKRLGNNDPLIAELLQMFLDGVPAQMSAIQSAVDVRHFEAVRRTAHMLKSGATNLSAMGVIEAASRLEAAGERREAAELTQLFARLVAEVDDLVGEVRGMLAAESLPRMRVLIADDDPLSAR
jgi:HPt (histidine-containing phosphotransfer) domain-containing protein